VGGVFVYDVDALEVFYADEREDAFATARTDPGSRQAIEKLMSPRPDRRNA
jgi:hypothetical protein